MVLCVRGSSIVLKKENKLPFFIVAVVARRQKGDGSSSGEGQVRGIDLPEPVLLPGRVGGSGTAWR